MLKSLSENTGAGQTGIRGSERESPLHWEFSSMNGVLVMRNGKWNLHFKNRNGDNTEVYDLSADPARSNNITNQEKGVADELSANLKDWLCGVPAECGKRQRDPICKTFDYSARTHFHS